MKAQDSFWAALKESFLEWCFGGAWQLEQYRKQELRRKECERIFRQQMAEFSGTTDIEIQIVRKTPNE